MNNIHASLSNHLNMRWFHITTSTRCLDHKHLILSLFVLILLIEDNSLGILTTISFTYKGVRKISHGFTFFFGLEGNIWLSRTMKMLILFCCMRFKIASNAPGRLKDAKSAKNQNMNNIHDSLSNHFNMRWFYITTSMRCFDHKHLTPSLLVLILLIEDNSLGILTTISFTNKEIRISHGFTFFWFWRKYLII